MKTFTKAILFYVFYKTLTIERKKRPGRKGYAGLKNEKPR